MRNTQLTEWRPFSPLFTEFPGLFQSLFAPFAGQEERQEQRGISRWTPRVNVRETEDSYLIQAEVPGCKAEDVKVTLTGDTLSITGEKCGEEDRREEDTWHVWERSYGSFQRTFRFPSPVEEQGVEAEYEQGVLKVTVKKSKEARSRQIEVKARSSRQEGEKPLIEGEKPATKGSKPERQERKATS